MKYYLFVISWLIIAMSILVEDVRAIVIMCSSAIMMMLWSGLIMLEEIKKKLK